MASLEIKAGVGCSRSSSLFLRLPLLSFQGCPLLSSHQFLLLPGSFLRRQKDNWVSHSLWASLSCWHSLILRYESAVYMSTWIFPAQIAGLPYCYAHSSHLSVSSWMYHRHLNVNTCQARTSVLHVCASAVHGAVVHFAYAKNIFLA